VSEAGHNVAVERPKELMAAIRSISVVEAPQPVAA
jgi:hypothetical protein